ncbi:MAG: hypothetical protein JST54_03795 [Deltaproteobacteria bacterium]|nr:hypothetical protein [Deltaproteobacteria bacterium]
MRHTVLATLAALLVTLVAKPARAVDVAVFDAEPIAAGWEQVRDQDGVKVYTRKTEGTSLYALRSDGVVDAPLDKVAQVFFDHARTPEWIDRMADEHVVRFLGATEYVEYNRVNLPFPFSDRDYVTRVHVHVDTARNRLEMTSSSIDAPDLPSTCVRGSLETAYVLSSVDGGAHTRIQVLYLMDPNGALPHWVVNIFQKSWPLATFRGIRKQLLKPDLREPPLQQLRDVVSQLRALQPTGR